MHHMILNESSLYHLGVHNSLKGSFSRLLVLVIKHLLQTKQNLISNSKLETCVAIAIHCPMT